MYFILIGSLIATCVISNNDCIYGSFTENRQTNGCMFYCRSDERLFEISSLSFDFIKEKCSNIEEAAIIDTSQCNDLSDLVWSTKYCGCPQCKCSKRGVNIIKSRTLLNPRPTKLCYNCVCRDSYIADLSFDCDVIEEIDDPDDWNEFNCPPNECTDSDGNTKSATSYWWENADTDNKCTKFCYCNGDGSTTCSDGFSNILSSSNANLRNKFIRSCDGVLKDCMDDPSRMFTDDPPSNPPTSNVKQNCNGCGKCDCGSHSVGDIWYVEYQDYDRWRHNDLFCGKCSCQEGPNGNNYAKCDLAAWYPIGFETCPPSKKPTMQCHVEDSYNATVGTLQPRNCTSFNDYDTIYCDWGYSAQYRYFDGMAPYEWGCARGNRISDIFCEAYANNTCISYNVTPIYTDCGGVRDDEIQTMDEYRYCCNTGDNCNHENIDINSCEKNTEYGNLIKSYRECQYNEIPHKYGCNNYKKELTCSNLREYYKDWMKCSCTFYGQMYDRISAASKIKLQRWIDIDRYNDNTEWNDVLGCNIDLKCDLGVSGGGRVVDNEGVNKVYFTAILWVIFVIMTMKN